MIARIRTVQGDQLYIDPGDRDRARQRGRKLIPIRDKTGSRLSWPGEGDLLLHVDNIATAGGR
jgi:hypothetical protein